jgi:hypothetical protein
VILIEQNQGQIGTDKGQMEGQIKFSLLQVRYIEGQIGTDNYTSIDTHEKHLYDLGKHRIYESDVEIPTYLSLPSYSKLKG